MVTTAIDGVGTAESVWRPWLARRTWPAFDVGPVLARRRVVVLAAHPDDEVLGVGGVLRRLAGCGASVVMVWATDGEASHPESTRFARSRLGALRRAESVAAIGKLGIAPQAMHHLGLPDSGLASHLPELIEALRAVVDVSDVVFAPWRGDGHPDHEAAGEAAAELGTTLVEYPIWMWHWASPDDDRVPWARARAVTGIDLAAKTTAIAAFATQVRPIGPDPADVAVLPPHVLERFTRPDELVFQ
ncbi:MAG TPA: PIG-L family deacetylase [Mycobacteriales bacterium]|jgi:LmbE family N-acetylglucosaminyl deacetylase|nr:PIG-L family deacetylase [Mycobacteriales bacterium]